MVDSCGIPSNGVTQMPEENFFSLHYNEHRFDIDGMIIARG